jgi:hypothetical protein
VPTSITYGNTGTASASGGSGTGAVSFSAGALTGCSVDATTGVISVINVTKPCAITATKAGNDNYKSASDGPKSVTLNGYTFSGFLSPLNPDPTVVNTGNAGRTYPIKWWLKDASGNYVTTAVSATTINVAKVACSNLSGDPTDTIDYAADQGGTSLRYDSTANQYVYNWASPSTKNTCYRMTVTTPDGQLHAALFQMK